MRILFLLFILLPITELMLLFEVGQRIGALPTIGLVLLTATVGVNILRRQGLGTLARARQRLAGGELPGQELVEGFLLGIGGALLLTPGFLTDALGLALLLPWSRKALARSLLAKGRIQTWSTVYGARTWSRTGPGPAGGRGGGDIFEGEFSRERPPGRSLPDQDRDDPRNP